MYLSHLKLNNFKNYNSAELHFSRNINCFIGKNAAGKTNILDAIYYLSFCKSFFNPVDNQNIRHQQDFFAIHGTYLRNGDDNEKVSCIQKRNQKKEFRYNSKTYDRLSDHIGKFPLVMISPYDRDLINEGSEIRRKFIDSVISQFDKVYLNHLILYNKALFQRNTLLKQFAEHSAFNPENLAVWDEKLILHGTEIYQKRKSFINDYFPIFQKFFKAISGGKEEAGITYKSGLEHEDFRILLKSGLEKDLLFKYTTQGIHKDELVFSLSGFPIKKFGSQGQQKSFVISVKLAQFDYTRHKINYKPILLFDDIFDKLDENRVQQIIRLAGNESFGQVFISDTQKERIDNIFHELKSPHKVFYVEEAEISVLENE